MVDNWDNLPVLRIEAATEHAPMQLVEVEQGIWDFPEALTMGDGTLLYLRRTEQRGGIANTTTPVLAFYNPETQLTRLVVCDLPRGWTRCSGATLAVPAPGDPATHITVWAEVHGDNGPAGRVRAYVEGWVPLARGGAGSVRPLPPPVAGHQTFTDVPPASPFWGPIESCAAAGLVSGHGATFDPNSPLTRGQLCAIMARFAAYLAAG